MDRTELDRAIRALCQRFRWHCRVEILLVGGAAGMLTGVFPRDRVTVDCDVISYLLADAWVHVELLADKIGKEFQLPDHWFNGNVQQRVDALPDGWKTRRVWVESGEWLEVFAASAPDLLAMKFLAHRPQDLEDIDKLGVTRDDKDFVRAYLAGLPAKGTPAEQIAEAAEILESWPVRQ